MYVEQRVAIRFCLVERGAGKQRYLSGWRRARLGASARKRLVGAMLRGAPAAVPAGKEPEWGALLPGTEDGPPLSVYSADYPVVVVAAGGGG